jgi:NhaP-type Na+/H+ or K+/H+ antiporter
MANCVEYMMAAVMAIGVIGGFFNRWHTKRGIGERFTQYIAFVLAVPATVILAAAKLIGPETSAAVLGVTIGFAAAVAGRDKTKKEKPPTR